MDAPGIVFLCDISRLLISQFGKNEVLSRVRKSFIRLEGEGGEGKDGTSYFRN